MNESLLNRLLRDRKRQRRMLGLILCLSMIVSLGTFAGFHKNAIAKVYTREVLDCPYAHEGAAPVAHTHNDDCYEGDLLVCTLPEREAHTHADACYAELQVLRCGLEESEGHQHTGECFDEDGALTCGMEAGEGAHVHSEACFENEYALICDQLELPTHVHGPECFRTEEITVDEPEEVIEPETPAQPEQTIPEMPVSDPNADLETAEDWNREFEDFELSGNWARDLVLVAATQQGRGESPNNFEAVLNDAGDAWVKHGYTRYGAWYGVPYADEWSAMFVSFCLRYAGIPEENVPNNPTAAFMAESFSMGELFAGRDYVPAAGDLIFFGTVDDDIVTIDHMGIVYHVDPENGTINTVEGDRTNAVATFGYYLDDEQIVGYGILPQNPNYIPAEGELEEKIDEAFDSFIFMTTDEEEKPKETETVEETTDTDEATVPAVPMPAQSWERTAGGIKVSVEAPEGAFPENTRIAVTPVNGSSLMDTVSEAVDGAILEVQAVDITFFDAEGREIEPAVPIRVVMTPAATEHAEEKTSVVHVDVAQQTAELIEQAEGTETDNSEVVFEAEAFTIYAIVYSVDFEYEVNGKVFTSSMPGAEDMPLSEIVRGLGIVGEEKLETFLSKIVSVTSTNEEVAIVTENGEIRVLKDGEAQIVIAMQDGAKFEIDVKADGETSVEAENVAISTVNDLFLPTAAVAKAEAVQDEAAVEAVRAETSTAESGVKTIYQVFDISLENVEADQYEGFRVDLKLPERVDNRNLHLYHVHDGKVEELQLDHVEAGEAAEAVEAVSFVTPSFSYFVLSYTVDFHYEIDGQSFDFSLPGGGFIAFSDLVKVLGIMEAVPETEEIELPAFVENVETLAFSDPSLLWTGKVEHDTTVGTLKGENGLRCEYSAELTNEEIAAINATEVTAVDWALISLKPFTSEEILTVTMKNGEVFTIRVTDAQEIPDAEKASIDVNKSYLICYEVNGVYYLLKNDGTVDSAHHPDFDGDPDAAHDFEHLNSTYAWTFNHIFKEQDVEHHLDKNYYLIRPIDNKSKTLTLNIAGDELVQQGNNNVAVYPSAGGFILEGYHNVGTEEEHRYIHLGFDGSAFVGVDGEGVTVHIYEMAALPTYDYTVRSADEIRGTVTVDGGIQITEHHEGTDDTHYYDATSNHDKKNAGTITATPVTHMNQGQNKWLFDHWEQDGLPLDRDQYGEMIAAETLPIPYNGSNLVAYFRQNPAYVVPANEKEPSSIEDMSGWLNELQNRKIPLDPSATKKTAEVYDYQNRIYRVDFTSKANFETFAGNIDMAFCLDVSNSMFFPSALVATASANRANPMPIYQINNSYSGNDWWNNYNNRGWLDTSRGWNNPYYLVADASGTATVFKIYYQGGNWKAQDASRTTESEKSFVIGGDFKTNWTADQYDNQNNKNHPFSAGDNDNTTYMIYDAGDNGNNRFVYLNQSLSGSSTDLNTIANLLAVAGDASPGVKIAYNTFNKDLGSQRRDFQAASPALTVNLEYASGGGTRPDQAFNDAQNFSWTANYTLDGSGNLTATDRYVILVTDGAPQGVRSGEAKSTTNAQIETWVREAAEDLKDKSHVKLITVGLSMENVTSGKRLLYDLADFDNNGNKMFYLAESGSDLHNIFRQITKVLMEDAVVLGDITDTVSEGFYLVDKATGLPLVPGDMIDIEGIKTADVNQAAGVVQTDGRTIVWTNQAIDSLAGWHGTVYVKAQEELLGGNAMNTNSGEATIVATKYHVGGNDVPFDTALVRDTLNLTASLPSPKVNVNELTFFNNETEWTVYLGTDVDPKQQLKALYESLVVEEVVNGDGTLHYTLGPNTIEERWDTADGTAATFSLPGLLERLIRKDSTMAARYFSGSELNWDNFLKDIMGNGITLPYHEYGLTDGGNIVITLEKRIAENEEDDLINKSPHVTTVTGNKVEQYVLRIQYSPDYAVTPIGQGGQSTEDFHTGTFGSMYQGHATGRETSTNTHAINVYAEPLDVKKVNDYDETVPGAVFKLYRAAKQGELGEPLSSYDASLSGSYYCISTAESDANGIAHLAPDDTPSHTIPVAAGQTAQKLLVSGETYYLVEAFAPSGYMKDNTVRTVTVETGPDLFTKLDGTTPVESENISGTPARPTIVYNWDEGVTITVNDLGSGESENKAALVDHETREAVTLTDAGGNPRTYLLSSDSSPSVVTQVVILNSIITDIRIQKTDINGTGLAGAIFQLKKLGADGHSESDVEGITGIDTITETINGGQKTFTSAFKTTGEVQTFEGLPDGTYRLYEVHYPAGYVVTFRYIQFTLEKGIMKNIGTDSGNTSIFDFTASENNFALLIIKNTPGVALPMTGGSGTALFIVLGGFITASAGAILTISLCRRRRRAAEG